MERRKAGGVMLQPNEPQETPEWSLPARDLLYPHEWRGPEDDPENIERGTE